MSCAIPVICTPVGSIPEYIKDGENGYLFPRKDIKALKEKITQKKEIESIKMELDEIKTLIKEILNGTR